MKKELNRILSKLSLIINNSINSNLLDDIEKEFHGVWQGWSTWWCSRDFLIKKYLNKV